MNSYIIFLVLALLNIILIKKLMSQNEQFQQNSNIKGKLDKIYKGNINLFKIDSKRIQQIKDDSSLFSQFCKKIKYFDDNYDSSSKLRMFANYSKNNIKKKLIKKQDKLLENVFDLQKKIYFNDDDIEKHKQYEQKLNSKTSEYISILDKAIQNLKNNLNPEIIVN